MVKGSALIKKKNAKYWLFLDNYLKFIFYKSEFLFCVFVLYENMKTYFSCVYINS